LPYKKDVKVKQIYTRWMNNFTSFMFFFSLFFKLPFRLEVNLIENMTYLYTYI
jgi:hypothetical protein